LFLSSEGDAMIEILETEVRSPMKLIAETAADLMTPNPISIRDTASVHEAITCLTDKAVTAVPVINDAGRAADPTRVFDIMTPAVFCIRPEADVRVVVEQMLGYKVHRLFVVNEGGTLIGTISAHDILSNLE
jgi:CBS domain-containing protein